MEWEDSTGMSGSAPYLLFYDDDCGF